MKVYHVGLLALIIMLFCLSGCGHSSIDNEVVGQVKKVKNVTPIIFPNYTYADVSLGVMRNGVGSMSTEDIFLWIPDNKLVQVFKDAAESGALVKIKYNDWRWRVFYPETYAVSIELIK